jgi:hypothetical protein
MTNEATTTGVTWGDIHPGSGERTITIATDSTAAAGLIIKGLLEEEPAPDADDLRDVTWNVAVIYMIPGGYMDVSGHLPGIGLRVSRLYRIIVAPFDTRFRDEGGKKVNDAAMILHILGMGELPRLIHTFYDNPYETHYAFTRSSND